jgi:hypothetical protein
MRESRSSGSVEGVLGNWHSYSDLMVREVLHRSRGRVAPRGGIFAPSELPAHATERLDERFDVAEATG